MTNPWEEYGAGDEGAAPWEEYQRASTPPVSRPRNVGSALAEGARYLQRYSNPLTGARHLFDDLEQSGGRLGAGASGFRDAYSLGFGDELAGVEAGIARLLTGGDYREGYSEAARTARDRINRNAANHPLSFGAGQIGGGIVGGVSGGAVARGALGASQTASNLAARAGIGGRLAGAGVGGALGYGAYNAGTMEGTVDERAAAGAAGLLPGAAMGVIGQGVLGEALPYVGGRLQRAFSPQAGAANDIGEMARRFEFDGSTLENELERVAPYGGTLMDAMPGGTSLVAGAGVRPSIERVLTRDFLDARNNAMGQEAIDDVWRTLAPNATSSGGRAIVETAESMRRNARPLYDAAYQRPVRSVPATTREIVRRNPELFGPAMERARLAVLSETGQEATDAMPLYWHRVLEEANSELRGRLRAASMGDLRGFRGSEAARYSRALDEFDDEVRNMLGDDFGRAQDIWAGGSRFNDAVEAGLEAFSPKANDLRLTEIVERLERARRLGRASELEGYRLGAITAVEDAIANANTGSGRADVLRAIVRSDGQRRVWRALFGENPTVENLLRRMDIRRELFQNSAESGIGVGSQTAPLTAARESQEARSLAGGFGRDNIVRFLTGGIMDRYQEGVSNNILREMRRPAGEVLEEIRDAGGYQRWVSRRKGLVSRALQSRAPRANATRRLSDATFGYGLYGSIGGDTLASYSTGTGF